MLTLDITDHADKVRDALSSGRCYHVVDGDRCECRPGPHEQGRCQAAWPEVSGEARYVPLPWRDLPETCQTCGGKGYEWVDGPYVKGEGVRKITCPDCVDGRPIVELRARCPNRDDWEACIEGWVYGPCSDDHCTGVCEYWGECQTCCGRGYVRLARAVVTVLPVFGNKRTPRPPVYVWIPGDGSAQIGRLGATPMFTPLPLDPVPQPDQFVIVYEFVP